MIRFSIAASRTGITVSKLNRRFRALLISFTPLSLVLAVPITLKPLWKEYYEARKWLR